MNQKSENKIKAIDLMLLDLKTSHSGIRVQAKKMNCELELEEWKE